MATARLTIVAGTRSARRKLAFLILLYLLALWLAATALRADDDMPVHITRAQGPITIDADLSDPGWKGATRLETWFETNPGDNLPAKIKSVGYLTYDDRFFYAAFEFSDPDPVTHPRTVRGPRQRLRRHATTAGSSSTRTTTAARPSSCSPTLAASSTTRSATTSRVRTARRTSTGTRSRRSRTTAGSSRCAFPSPRCAIPRAIRRRGRSCSIATIRGSSATSSSRRSCRADRAASSVTARPSRAWRTSPPADTSSSPRSAR